jgi:hypothetical protein
VGTGELKNIKSIPFEQNLINKEIKPNYGVQLNAEDGSLLAVSTFEYPPASEGGTSFLSKKRTTRA